MASSRRLMGRDDDPRCVLDEPVRHAARRHACCCSKRGRWRCGDPGSPPAKYLVCCALAGSDRGEVPAAAEVTWLERLEATVRRARRRPLVAANLGIDERQGDQYGWALDYETATSAHQAALGECGSGYSVVLAFERCAAYAADQAAASTAVGWAESSASPGRSCSGSRSRTARTPWNSKRIWLSSRTACSGRWRRRVWRRCGAIEPELPARGPGPAGALRDQVALDLGEQREERGHDLVWMSRRPSTRMFSLSGVPRRARHGVGRPAEAQPLPGLEPLLRRQPGAGPGAEDRIRTAVHVRAAAAGEGAAGPAQGRAAFHGALAALRPATAGSRVSSRSNSASAAKMAEREAAGRGRGVDLRPLGRRAPAGPPPWGRQVLDGVDQMGGGYGRGRSSFQTTSTSPLRMGRPACRAQSPGRASELVANPTHGLDDAALNHGGAFKVVWGHRSIFSTP